MRQPVKTRRGSALMLVLIFMTAMLILGLPLLMAAQMSVSRGVVHTAVTGQYYAAEAAVQVAAQEFFVKLKDATEAAAPILTDLEPQALLDEEEDSPFFYLSENDEDDAEVADKAEALKDLLREKNITVGDGVQAKVLDVALKNLEFEQPLDAEGNKQTIIHVDADNTEKTYFIYCLKSVEPEIIAEVGGTRVTLTYGYKPGVSVTVDKGETVTPPDPVHIDGMKQIGPGGEEDPFYKRLEEILGLAEGLANTPGLQASLPESAKENNLSIGSGGRTFTEDIVYVQGNLTIGGSTNQANEKYDGTLVRSTSEGGTTIIVGGNLQINTGGGGYAQNYRANVIENCRFYVQGNILINNSGNFTGLFGNSVYIGYGPTSDIRIDTSGPGNTVQIGSASAAPQFYARQNFRTDMWSSGSTMYGIYAVLGQYQATDGNIGGVTNTAPPPPPSETTYDVGPDPDNPRIVGGIYAPSSTYTPENGASIGVGDLPEDCDMMDLLFTVEVGDGGDGEPVTTPDIIDIGFDPKTTKEPVIYDSTGEAG